MAGSSLYRLGVKPLSGTVAKVKDMANWEERVRHLEPMVPYLAADYLKRYLQYKLPKSQQYRSYRKGLEVAQVSAMPSGQYGYAVQFDTHSRYVKQVRTQHVLLYVYATRRMGRPDPIGEILEKYNPWTFDSLPLRPDSKHVTIQTRKALPRLVHNVTDQRRHQRMAWQVELARAGVRKQSKQTKLKIGKTSAKVPDLALQALYLEFGNGKEEPKPLWRLGINHLRRQGLRAFARDKKLFAYPFTRPSFRMWKKWPPRTKHKVNKLLVRRYSNFQNKVRGH